MYVMGVCYNVVWDGLLGGDYCYQGWGYGVGMIYGCFWLLSKCWNMEVEVGLGLFVVLYIKYCCEYCGDKVKLGIYFLLIFKLVFNFVYLF